MLFSYGRQLVTARRLARYRRALRGAEEPVIPPEVKRRALVERVAREIMENLLVSGSDNPVVDEIEQRLQEEFGAHLIFTYPPMQLEIQVFREGPNGPEEIAPAEKMNALDRLWEITLEIVDETML
jgi:alkanesulfonate monooxygenase SsuD/methylene tetrahydromethanopterin reductase-like flavin-dependent oxidoreductase (luciferase family)